MLEHGGRLRHAATHYQIPLVDWLDLSTGLAPYCWPLPPVPMRDWMRLPEEDDGLEIAAVGYYGTVNILPVAGSQAAIQTVPSLFAGARVAIIEPCYAEHRHAWERQGFAPLSLRAADVEAALPSLDVLVVVNPNNPTGSHISAHQLWRWRERLASRGGCLVVDEAFCDLQPELSLASKAGCPGLVVLRSLGKFFGLAGARLGFVLAERSLLAALHERVGPWTVSGPARRIGQAVLNDRETQALWRLRIQNDGARLGQLLAECGLPPAGNTGLFAWVPCDTAEALHGHLARLGILVRHVPEPSGVRFGLPGCESGWRRLEQALRCFEQETAKCRP
jgi:cobalamin biosynthesis protein CobC